MVWLRGRRLCVLRTVLWFLISLLFCQGKASLPLTLLTWLTAHTATSCRGQSNPLVGTGILLAFSLPRDCNDANVPNSAWKSNLETLPSDRLL